MDELRYQNDLLKAMNQKLEGRSRMYSYICERSDCAILYYSFDHEEVVTLGRFSDFFQFEIKSVRSLSLLSEHMDEKYSDVLLQTLFPERDGKEKASCECLDHTGKIWYSVRVEVFCNENRIATDKVIYIKNITKTKSQYSEMLYMAYYDGLTGLFNRNYFIQKLSEMIHNAEFEGVSVALMLVDIDGFKKINDSLGLVVGDELLQQVGSFLRDLCDSRVIGAHLTNDVFALAIYNPLGYYSVEEMHKHIDQRMKDAFHMSSGQDINISVSIGVAEYPEAAGDALELLSCAEIVMFRCKTAGDNSILYFDTPILNEFLKTVEMEAHLKDAVFQNNFVLYYQPQVHAGNGKLRGFEALLRWKDGENGMIPPSTFIPVAEKNGTILPIGKFVLEESIKQYAEWSRKYRTRFIMSINISALQYKKDDFVDMVMECIYKNHVEPNDIELEITESLLIDDFDNVRRKLDRLRSFGVRISLDDFGTGYSSLGYLKKLPIDTLKIDKSFIDTVLGDVATRIITESIINMTRTLGFETVAEGVEMQQQYDYLHSVGCDVIQGYYFGKPLDPDGTAVFLNKEFEIDDPQ